jgi:hypothetical protein
MQHGTLAVSHIFPTPITHIQLNYTPPDHIRPKPAVNRTGNFLVRKELLTLRGLNPDRLRLTVLAFHKNFMYTRAVGGGHMVDGNLGLRKEVTEGGA